MALRFLGASLPLVLQAASGTQLRTDDASRTEFEASEEFWEQKAFEEFRSDWQRRHTSPWKPMEQGAANGRNLCMDGKQVPDFYVLGVQKCATSSIAMDLMDAGMQNVHGDLNPKEFHWFDHRNDYSLVGKKGDDENRRELLKWMPTCPTPAHTLLARLRGVATEDKRIALADFTPDYLRVVPMPTDLERMGTGWLDVNEENRSMPILMRRLYGDLLAEKLKFAVMIRDPLSQMQSAWYHAESFNFHNACRSCKAPSFEAALSTLVDGLSESPPRYTAWLWTVLYARQLEHWFEHFHPAQFHIIPEGEYVRGDKDRICREVSDGLDFKMNCWSGGEAASHAWSHPHPKLEDDAPKPLREKFHAFMVKERERLVKLLAKAQANGLTLAAYDGATGSEADVLAWLQARW